MQTPAITLWFPKQCVLGFFILEKQLASQNMFFVRSELSITVYLLYCIKLHHYSIYRFSKISRPFCESRNWWIIVVFLQSNNLTITIISQKYRELLQPYSHDCFSKISRTFYASRKSWIIVVFLQCTLKKKLPIFLINTLLLHIPFLALTDGQNDRQRNEYTRCAWAGGTFFPVVLSCQFLVLVGNRFWFYILMY